MKLLFIADIRSPIAQNWIRFFVEAGHDVHVISSYPCTGTPLPGAQIYLVPFALSGLLRIGSRVRGNTAARETRSSSRLAWRIGGRLYPFLSAARYSLAPLDVWRHVPIVRRLVSEIQPDLVHAMRIPYEGIMASLAVRDTPLLISVWGNDFTLHARRRRMIRMLTRHTLRRVDALHCDCLRDLSLAHAWGFDASKPSIVLPGAGGIRLDIFHPRRASEALRQVIDIPPDSPVILNPRGFRQYVRNDAFFDAIPLVLRRVPTAIFLCSSMRQHPLAGKYVRDRGIGASVRLLPMVPHSEMAQYFRLADVAISPSEHDGTPNTLLEAMACGCFPIAGNIESIHEWITDGVNGLLCDPRDPRALADAMVRAIEDAELRAGAATANFALVQERAEYWTVMHRATGLYQELVERSTRGMNEEPCAASPA